MFLLIPRELRQSALYFTSVLLRCVSPFAPFCLCRKNGMLSRKMKLEEIQSLFPVRKKWIYVNHAGVGPLSLPVKDAVEKYLNEAVNEGYLAGPNWHALMHRARVNTAKLLNAEADEIAFTSSTSDGLSYVANGIDWQKGDNLLVPDCEFPANIYPWLNLKRRGVEVRFIQTKNGGFSVDQLDQLADNKTRLLSTSSVQYGTGCRAPLKKIGEWCVSRKILFCVDAIQSLGALPMDVRDAQIDFLAADGHKWLMAPEGTALFYCSRKAWNRLTPAQIGWKSVVNPLDFDHVHFDLKENAQKFEPGSDNVMGVHALNAAIELLLQIGIENVEKQIKTCTGKLRGEILKQWPGAKIISPEEPQKQSGIVAVQIESDPVQAVERLTRNKIYAASRRGFLRFSPHVYNDISEMEKLVQTGKEIV